MRVCVCVGGGREIIVNTETTFAVAAHRPHDGWSAWRGERVGGDSWRLCFLKGGLCKL